MIFRLSQELNTKINAGTLNEMPLDENSYADWSCHLLTAGRRQHILMCNTTSLYSVVMLGNGITTDSKFIERAMSNICEFMEADGQPLVYQQCIAPACGRISFARRWTALPRVR